MLPDRLAAFETALVRQGLPGGARPGADPFSRAVGDYLDGTDTSTFDLIHLEDNREDCAAIWPEFARLNA